MKPRGVWWLRGLWSSEQKHAPDALCLFTCLDTHARNMSPTRNLETHTLQSRGSPAKIRADDFQLLCSVCVSRPILHNPGAILLPGRLARTGDILVVAAMGEGVFLVPGGWKSETWLSTLPCTAESHLAPAVHSVEPSSDFTCSKITVVSGEMSHL